MLQNTLNTVNNLEPLFFKTYIKIHIEWNSVLHKGPGHAGSILNFGHC